MLGARKIAVMGSSKLSNQKSLTFDGSNDHLNCGNVLDIGTADFTLSIWAKASDWNNTNLIAKHEGSADFWRWQCDNANPPTMRYYAKQADGTFLGTYVGGSGINLDLLQNQWVHFILSNDRSGNVTGYINGQLDDADSSDATNIANSGNLTIAALNASDTSAMSISEVAIYNKALSGTEAVTMYNGREPYNHKEGPFAGNLTGWWRMGDGSLDEHVGNSGIIQDLTNEGFGNDVITNGGFDADSNWTKGDFTIGSGIATVTTDGANQYIKQVNLWSDNANDGKVVKLEYEITANTDTIALKAGGYAGTDLSAQKTLVSTVGIHRIYIFVSNSGTSDSLTFHVNHTAGETISIDNVKLSVSNGAAGSMVNMAANDIVGDTP